MALLPALILLTMQTKLKSPSELEDALHHLDQTGYSQAAIAYIKTNDVAKGMIPRIEDRKVAFGLQSESAQKVEVHLAPNGPTVPLTNLGNGYFANVADLNYMDAYTVEYFADGKKVGDTRRVEVYKFPAEMRSDPIVAKGELKQMPKQTSKIYPDTSSDWWIYKPAKPEPEGGYGLIVFQDGAGPKGYALPCLDNMIAKGDIPPCIAVFISPSVGISDKKSYRSRQYDVLSDEYVRYFLDEYEPVVASTLGVKISQDPMKRCIAGVSSGGICAWTAAWERPDKFGLVLSWVGSFTNIASGATNKEGGHNYPALIRKVDKKPIRAFLQDGDQDLDNIHGNWFLSCEQMAAALKFKGYDYMFTPGHGFHSETMGRSEMPDALRWLFSGK
jgi:enterochelin esterase-like enzyme